ncbi:MAG TPA: hypothetical protein VM265_10465 [Sphingomicrobium sp.]|nr:hypothetical protein [Sphingomicrobium sp.]
MMKYPTAAILGAMLILAACGQRNQTGPDNVAGGNAAQAPAATTTSPPTTSAIEVAKVTLEVRDRAPFGPHLTDADGRAVYIFTRDSEGASNCRDRCLQDWPPLLQKGVLTAGSGVDQGKIGTIVRDGGLRQVTYAGRPLYYYIAAQVSNVAAVQGIRSHDGQWYLISPTGDPIQAARS